MLSNHRLGYTSSVVRMFFVCEVLLIAEIVDRFKKIDRFVINLRKLGFKPENKSNHWQILNTTEA